MIVYMDDDVYMDDAVDMDVNVDDDVDMGVSVDDAIHVTDKVFSDWGWSPVRSSCNTRYVYDGDPYNEFIIARCADTDADTDTDVYSVSVPVPNYGVQYRTTMRDFTDACAFLRNHLDYFMKANRAC